MIRALLLLIEREDSAGEIYNIGKTESITIRELAEFITTHLHSSSKIEEIPYDLAYANGFEDMLHRMPDCSKIRNFCGWEAKISLTQIIDDVAAFYKAE